MTVVKGDVPPGIEPWKFWIVHLARYEKDPKPIRYSLSALCTIFLYAVYLKEVSAEMMSRRNFLELVEYLESNWQFLSPQIQKAIPYRSLIQTSLIDWDENICFDVQKGCQAYLSEIEDQFSHVGTLTQKVKAVNESLRRETIA